MATRISYNVNGQQIIDPNRYLNFIKEAQPTTVLVMDSPDMAIQTYEAGGGKTKVVHRFYNENDHLYWLWTSPSDFVATHTGWGHPEIYRYVLNEPSFDDSTLGGLLDWLIQVAYKMKEAGYRAVLGNFSVACYEPRHIGSGVFDKFLKMMDDLRDWHYFGIHEYTGILLPYGVGYWPVSYLLDKILVQPERWPAKKDVPFSRWGNDLPPYWHLCRSAWFNIRCDELKIRRPNFWMTEFGWDDMPDMHSLQPDVYTELRNRYGVPSPFISLRCINTLQPIWEDYFKDWSYQRTGFEQLKWAEQLYPENYIGFNLFTLSNDWGWKNQYGCDFAELYELQELIIADSKKPIKKSLFDLFLEFLAKLLDFFLKRVKNEN